MNDHSVLLKQLNRGSYKAFETLYKQYFDLLFGFVFKMTRSRKLAAEIVQDTFIKVWIYRERIDCEQSFKAWLYKIARNQLADHLKNQVRMPLFEDYLKLCSNEDFIYNNESEDFDFDAFIHSLSDAKKKLSPRQLEVFELNKEQDIPIEIIAERLDISKQAVYNYLSQAMSILRKTIGVLCLLFFPFSE